MFKVLIVSLVAVLAGPLSAAPLDYLLFDGRRGAGPAPLVILLHGAGGTGALMRRMTGFDRHAATAGIVAVYASAPNRVWNDGRLTGLPHRPRHTSHDDVAGLMEIVAELSTRGIVDPDRIYLFGHSSGGGMALQMACSRPEALAGIAVVVTKVLTNAPCADRTTPVPAVFFYGTEDSLNPHAGRSDPADPRAAKLGLSLSAAQSLAVWQQRNRCGAPVTRRLDPADDGVRVTRLDYIGCAAPMRYFEIEGGGHAIPGTRLRRSLLPREVPEVEVHDIDAMAEALRFLLGGPG